MNLQNFLPDHNVINGMTTIIPKGIVVHHSAGSSSQTIESLRDWFLVGRAREGYVAIGYHVVIYPDGTMYQCRPFNKNGGGCPGYNNTHIQVCFMGDYRKDRPTRSAWQSFSNLAHHLMNTYGFSESEIIPHSVAKAKAGGGGTICPGDHILALLKTPLLPSDQPAHEPARADISQYSAVELAEALLAKLK